MKTIDLGDGVCLGGFEAYNKLKSHFQKFIHVVDYPNFKKIDECAGNFVVLNSEELENSTIRELDKFAYYPHIEGAETIFIDADDVDTGAVIAVICKTTRNKEVFASMAEVAERLYWASGSVPVFRRGQMEPVLRYFRRLFMDKMPRVKKQYVLT